MRQGFVQTFAPEVLRAPSYAPVTPDARGFVMVDAGQLEALKDQSHTWQLVAAFAVGAVSALAIKGLL